MQIYEPFAVKLWSIDTKVVNWTDQTCYRNTFTCADMVLTDPIVENVYESKTQAMRSKAQQRDEIVSRHNLGQTAQEFCCTEDSWKHSSFNCADIKDGKNQDSSQSLLSDQTEQSGKTVIRYFYKGVSDLNQICLFQLTQFFFKITLFEKCVLTNHSLRRWCDLHVQ